MNPTIKKEIRSHIKKIMLEYTDDNGKRSVSAFCKANGLNYTNVVKFYNGKDIKLLRLFKAVLPAYNWPECLRTITVDCFIDLMVDTDIPYYWQGLLFSTQTGNIKYEKNHHQKKGEIKTDQTNFLQVIKGKTQTINELRAENKRLRDENRRLRNVQEI